MTNYIYLPLVLSFDQTGLIPTPTQSPILYNKKIEIIMISHIGWGIREPDEYVLIRNNESSSVQLEGWTLRDNETNIFVFPPFEMESFKECKIYTNQYDPMFCGFNFRSELSIWNNSGDCAYLSDNNGELIHQYCY